MDGAGISALGPTVGVSGLQSEYDSMVAAARALEAGQRGNPMPSGPRMPSSLSEMIPPELRNRLPSAETAANLVLGMAPGSGDYMAARDAIDATGAGISALGRGDYMRAGARGIDAMTAALGILPMVPYAAGMFAGRGAKTADVVKLGMAEKMAAAGASPEDIWRSTGWFQGADGKWRFEIDDSAVPITKRLTEAELWSYPQIRDALPHKQLFQAYPDIGDIHLGPEVSAKKLGSYDPNQRVLTVTPRDASDFSGQIGAAQKSIMLHEMQHAIQGAERMAGGGNVRYMAEKSAEARLLADEMQRKLTRYQNAASQEADKLLFLAEQPGGGEHRAFVDSAYKRWVDQLGERSDANPYGITRHAAVAAELVDRDPFINRWRRQLEEAQRLGALSPEQAYQRLAGEVEARAVQARMRLTPQQRVERAPWLDYDVPIDQQIVHGIEP